MKSSLERRAKSSPSMIPLVILILFSFKMMAAAVHFIYRGGGRNVIPFEVPHVTTHESVTFIPAELFYGHPDIVEIVCHDNVKKIGKRAFNACTRLRRVVMPDVEEVGEFAFYYCRALSHVECDELKIIGARAFDGCKSLCGINLPSARIVEAAAFYMCEAMEEVTFGKDLERVGWNSFYRCLSLKQITIPLKNRLCPYDSTFMECGNLMRVNIAEGGNLKATAAALFLDKWRNEMRTVIDSINHTLPNAYAGDHYYAGDDDSGYYGEKTIVIRRWISSVLSKIIRYKAQHRCLFNAAEALLLSLELPDEIVRNNVLPFLELPSHTFDGEDNTVVINRNLVEREY